MANGDAIHRSLHGYVGRSHQRALVGRERELAAIREYVFTTVGDRDGRDRWG